MNIQDIIKQAELLKKQTAVNSKKLENLLITGESGAGLVKIELTGNFLLKKLHIDPDLYKEDKQAVEQLIVAAFNDASNKVESERRAMLNSLNVPGDFKLPF